MSPCAWCRAAILDLAMAPLARQRARIVPQARGRVLDLGTGTGLNLTLLDPARVRSAVGIDPDPAMLTRARRRALPFPVELVQAGGEALPLPDASVDTVVATWVLCTVPDPAATVREALRVLRPGGRVIAAEHIASPVPWIHAAQRAVDPAWSWLAGGCHLTRDGMAVWRAAGVPLPPSQGRSLRWSPAPSVTGVADLPVGTA